MKQSAVEWIEEQLKSKYGLFTSLYPEFEQAKQMEAEHKIDAIIEYAKAHGFIGLVEELEQEKIKYILLHTEQTKASVEKVKEYQYWLREIPELSDKEIEEIASNYAKRILLSIDDENKAIIHPIKIAYISGMKAYREQLKQRNK